MNYIHITFEMNVYSESLRISYTGQFIIKILFCSIVPRNQLMSWIWKNIVSHLLVSRYYNGYYIVVYSVFSDHQNELNSTISCMYNWCITSRIYRKLNTYKMFHFTDEMNSVVMWQHLSTVEKIGWFHLDSTHNSMKMST